MLMSYYRIVGNLPANFTYGSELLVLVSNLLAIFIQYNLSASLLVELERLVFIIFFFHFLLFRFSGFSGFHGFSGFFVF